SKPTGPLLAARRLRGALSRYFPSSSPRIDFGLSAQSKSAFQPRLPQQKLLALISRQSARHCSRSCLKLSLNRARQEFIRSRLSFTGTANTSPHSSFQIANISSGTAAFFGVAPCSIVSLAGS